MPGLLAPLYSYILISQYPSSQLPKLFKLLKLLKLFYYLPCVKKTLSRINTFWRYLVLCLACSDAVAQSASVQMGARAHGLANASACLSGVWSLHNNIAGLAETEVAAAGCTYDAVPSAEFFNRLAAVFAVPLRYGVAGAGIFRFGDDLYNEQIASLGFANTLGLVSLGLKINYCQYRANGLDTRSGVTVSFGGIAELTEQLFFGAHIVNINQPVISKPTDERMPTRLAAALGYRPSEKVFLTTEIEKDIEYDPTWKTGMEYTFVKKVSFRTGFQLRSRTGFFGLGFKGRGFNFDYALQFSSPSRTTHQATATFQFSKP